MPRLNTICVICDEKFKSTDIIHSTYCGHIFHECCLGNWKLIKLSCPMCQREFSSETFGHQLFLELDDQEENSHENNFINLSKTEVQSANGSDIQDQLRRMHLHFQSFQKQFVASEQSKRKLENQIQILDRKLHQLSDELEKVKLKRENYITATEQYECNPLIASNSVNKSENIIEKPQSLCSETDNYVVIEDFPVKHKTFPLEDKIIELGTMMRLSISRNDICRVRELGKYEYVPKASDKIALLVNFKTNDMKNKFLAKKNVLRKYLTTSYILRPIEDDIHSVYLYANEKLKHYGGFTDVSFAYDCVNVTHKDGQEFQVRSKMDVASLVKRNIEETAVKAAIAEKKFIWS